MKNKECCFLLLLCAWIAVSGQAPKFAPGVKIQAKGVDIAVGPSSGNLSPFIYDWNNDGKKDLLLGTFRSNKEDGAVSGAVLLYLNTGTNTNPVFGNVELLKADGKPISVYAL